jgi:quinoprotein glucose dehydrogenase
MNEAQIRTLVLNGRGFMPSFGFFSAAETDNLVDYILDRTQSDGELDVSADADTRKMFDDFAGAPYGHTGYNKFRDADGNPAVKPPWGTLNKIDLNEGEIVWRVPLGEFEELTKRGIPQTGAENYGGPIVTAGGLIFIGATRDEMFRAIDKRTGDVLWETRLPAGGYATPATYEVDGRQYVVIAAGGGKMDTKPGDSYLAFALPRE